VELAILRSGTKLKPGTEWEIGSSSILSVGDCRFQDFRLRERAVLEGEELKLEQIPDMQCTPSALKGYSYDCYFVKRKMLREVLMDIHAKTGSAGSIDPLLSPVAYPGGRR